MSQNHHGSALPPSFLPQKFQILSGSALKLIAIFVMLIDHSACILLSQYPPALTPLFCIGQNAYTPYRICRDIGRIAFPIFCFLLLEGFSHTRNRKNYGRNLLLFALISELPWNYMFADTWHYKNKMYFYFISGLSCLLRTGTFPGKPHQAIPDPERASGRFLFPSGRLWMEGLYLSSDHVPFKR